MSSVMFCFKLMSNSCFPVTDKYLKVWIKFNDVCNGAGKKKSQRNPWTNGTLGAVTLVTNIKLVVFI